MELERIGDFRVCGLKRGRLRRGLEGVLVVLLWGIRRASSRIFFFVWVLMLWSGERKGGMEVRGGKGSSKKLTLGGV